MADEKEPDVIVIEPEPELFEPHVYEHPLLDGDHADYQHAPATGGLDYPLPGSDEGVLVDEEEAEPKAKKQAREEPVQRSTARKS